MGFCYSLVRKKTMSDEIWKILSSPSETFCERRALQCLFHFLPAYFSPNGLTGGWEDCRKALANTRALCWDDLTSEEAAGIDEAINLIDRMFERR